MGNIKPNAHNLVVATLMVAIGFAIVAAAAKTPIANWPLIGSMIRFLKGAMHG